MPPRALSPSPPNDADQPPANRPRQHVFHPNFEDEDSDLIVRSSDGTSFAVPRAILIAHSSVFEDILSIPQPPEEEPSSSSKEDLPVIDISEESKPVEIFLRYLVPSRYLVKGLPPPVSEYEERSDLFELASVLEMAVKYDCLPCLDILARQHLPPLVEAWPRAGWAIAARFGQLENCKDALRAFARLGITQDGGRRYDERTRTWNKGSRDVGLGDIRLEYLERVPVSTLQNFCIVHSKVVSSTDGSYNWLTAADEFKL